MSNIEAITITVSSIAIAVAIIAAILFWWYGNMQRWYQHLSRTPRKNPAQAAETGGIMKLFTLSLKEDLSAENREVLETIVRMNSQRHLTSLFEDPIEKFYLFEALTDPSRFPWEGSEELPQGAKSRKQVSKQVR